MIYIVLFVLIVLLYLWLKAPSKPKREGGREKELVKDPYCGTYIPKESALKAQIGGKTYYFCSRKCLEGYREEAK